MASEDITLVLSHCPEAHHSHLLFQHDTNLRFHCNQPQPTHHNIPHHATHSSHTSNNIINNNNPKTTRELTGFIEHRNRHFQPQGGSELYRRGGVQEWDVRNGRYESSPSGDRSDSDDDDDNDNDDDMGGNGYIKKGHSNNISVSEKNGLIRGVMKEGNVVNDVRLIESHQQGQLCRFQNALTVADPNGELYYSQMYNGVEGSGVGYACGFSGRKDACNSSGSGESLRTILSDPLTGVVKDDTLKSLTGDLMDDAMILPCGHSFGSSGMQHIMRMKACYTCSHPVSENSAAPNLSLRTAIHAFLREEELQTNRASKRRNKLDQDKSKYGDLAFDQTRGRGVQFPFCVSERVIIKGNKRTPPRFVGREAIVTTQCLNGWCVVKTLDNAESVKLQYRSLAKIQDSQHSDLASSKTTTPTPNWL